MKYSIRGTNSEGQYYREDRDEPNVLELGFELYSGTFLTVSVKGDSLEITGSRKLEIDDWASNIVKIKNI